MWKRADKGQGEVRRGSQMDFLQLGNVFKITLWDDGNSASLGIWPKDTQPVSIGFRFLFISAQVLKECQDLSPKS